MQHRSRDAEASEACPSVRSKARNIPERRHGAEIIRNPRNDGWQGTNERKNGKEAERQKTHLQNGPHLAGAAARGSPRARLSAFHHGTCGNERTPPLSSCDALAGAELGRNGRYPFPAAIRSSDLTQAGRSAGRASLPEPPGSGVTNRRPREPHPLRRDGVTARRPCKGARLSGFNASRLQMSIANQIAILIFPSRWRAHVFFGVPDQNDGGRRCHAAPNGVHSGMIFRRRAACALRA